MWLSEMKKCAFASVQSVLSNALLGNTTTPSCIVSMRDCCIHLCIWQCGESFYWLPVSLVAA